MDIFSRPLFTGPSVVLTAPRPEDDAAMAVWAQDDQYLRLVDTDYARPQLPSGPPSDGIEFRIRERGDGNLIGFVALMGIEWSNRAGKVAIGIGEARCRGRGYGEEAMRLILAYAFDELNLHRVGLDVIEYNLPAIRLYEKLGFRLEGRQRERVQRNGQHFDLLDMGILSNEWRG